MYIQSIPVKTFKSFCCYSITDQIQDLILPSFKKEGLATLFCKHTTTAQIVKELEERINLLEKEKINLEKDILEASYENNISYLSQQLADVAEEIQKGEERWVFLKDLEN